MADALIPGPSRACNTKEAIMSFCVLVKWKCVTHTHTYGRVERSTRLKFLARAKKSERGQQTRQRQRFASAGNRRVVIDGNWKDTDEKWHPSSSSRFFQKWLERRIVIESKMFRGKNINEEGRERTNERRLKKIIRLIVVKRETNATFRATTRRMFHTKEGEKKKKKNEEEREWKSDRTKKREKTASEEGTEKKFLRWRKREREKKKESHKTFSGIFTLPWV